MLLIARHARFRFFMSTYDVLNLKNSIPHKEIKFNVCICVCVCVCFVYFCVCVSVYFFVYVCSVYFCFMFIFCVLCCVAIIHAFT